MDTVFHMLWSGTRIWDSNLLFTLHRCSEFPVCVFFHFSEKEELLGAGCPLVSNILIYNYSPQCQWKVVDITSPLHSLGNIHHYYSTNCHYAHIWSGSPQYLSSVHDRYPAMYVDDHIWKCTAELARAAILKSKKVLAVLSENLKTPWKKFSKF